jgi:L-aminopeptidase/D-esterase-like protein
MPFTDAERRQLVASDAAERAPIRWGKAGAGLGRLTYAEVVAILKPGVGQRYVAEKAGVSRSSVSRWLAANDFVVWLVPRWRVGQYRG